LAKTYGLEALAASLHQRRASFDRDLKRFPQIEALNPQPNFATLSSCHVQ
jgi:hypothetical protein